MTRIDNGRVELYASINSYRIGKRSAPEGNPHDRREC